MAIMIDNYTLVATVLTVYGIETYLKHDARTLLFVLVATVLTDCGM